MLTRQILMYVLLLTLPALSECVTSTCEIPSVEAGDDATLTIHFGEDLTNETSRDFTLVHQGHRAEGSHIMLSCHFSNGVVECEKTPCCTWERQVTDIFRVYIHNVSQELEGKFWGFVIPADMIEQKYCNFTLKEPPNSHESYIIYFLFLLFLLLSVIPIVFILMKSYRRYRYVCLFRKEWGYHIEEEPLLPEKIKVKKSAEEMYWLHCMKIWYPELDKKTHFLPPLRSNRDDQVLVPQSSRDFISESQQCHDQDNRITPSKCDSDVIDHRPRQLVLCSMQALADYGEEKEVLCKFLGVKRVDDAVKLCLLSDQLSDINNSSCRALQTWWQHSVSAFKQEQSMSIESYEHLVVRFCGPAKTVEVHCVTAPRLNIRTMGKAVTETGERVARIVLFPQQVDIFNQSPPRAFVTGPPGTGKTTVLIIQGLIWLQRGYDVHVVSTCDESRAATFVIEHQLQETAKTSTARSRVHRHQFDLRENREVENAIKLLKFMSGRRQQCIIADVAVRDYRESFRKFCDQLIKEVHCVYIWGASLHRYTESFCLQQFNLTIPVRAPAVVTEEVKKSLKIKLYAEVHDYTVNSVNIHTDSDRVMRITHRNGHLGHTSAWPLNCVQCGYEVFRILKELHVGQIGDSKTHSSLQYRDVLVLCDGYPTDDRRDCTGQVISTASGLVRGLRESEIPVRVVIKGDELAIRDMALGAGDLVTVARWRDVLGLERKVVFVETGFGLYDEPLYAMSCCSSQLVLIVPDYDGRKAC